MPPIRRSLVVQSLKRHEGLELKPYVDTTGNLTIGYGRNLDAKGISRPEADMLLENDVTDTIAACLQRFAWLPALDEARAAVIVEMAFNLGLDGLLGFKRMLAAVEQGDYSTAAAEMLASKWAAQVGGRANRLATQMETGKVARAA